MFSGHGVNLKLPDVSATAVVAVLNSVVVSLCCLGSERRWRLSFQQGVPGLWPHSTYLLQEFGWEVFNHPPYTPDLAPSDFHLFLGLFYTNAKIAAVLT